VVVRGRAQQADEQDLARGRGQAHQRRPDVLGADAAVDHAGVQTTPTYTADVQVALHAVEVDVAVNRGYRLPALELARHDAAAHVGDADAAARGLQARPRAQPRRHQVAAKGLGLDAQRR